MRFSSKADNTDLNKLSARIIKLLGATTGSLLFLNSSGQISQDTNLYYSSYLHKLSIGGGTTKLSTLTVIPAASFTASGTTSVSASTTVTGTGTKFLTEIGVGDRIAISNSPTLKVIVTAIASDTSLTVEGSMGGGGTQTIVIYPSAIRVDQASGSSSMLVSDYGVVAFGGSSYGRISTGLYVQGVSNTSTTANVGLLQINKSDNFNNYQGIYIGIANDGSPTNGQGYIQYMTGDGGGGQTVANGDLILQPRGGTVIIGTALLSNQACVVSATNNAYLKISTTNGGFGGHTNDRCGLIFQSAGTSYNTSYEKSAIVYDSSVDSSNLGRGNLCFAIENSASGANAVANFSTCTIMNLGYVAQNVTIGQNATVGTGKLNVLSTTEQLRIYYDTSNYYSTTVGSTGGVTFDAVGSGSAFTFADAVTGNVSISTPIQKNTAAQTTVNASTSGSIICSQPNQGSSYKNVIIYCNAVLGTATYTYPTAFSQTPEVLSQSLGGIAAATTTSVTITGTTSTGFIEINGY